MKVKLNIPERLAGLRLLNEGGDTLSLVGLTSAHDLVRKFSIDEKEQKEVGYKINKVEGKDGNISQTVTWEKQDYIREFDFSNEEVDVINDLVEKKDKDKKFSISEGLAIVDLAKKFKK